MVRLRPMRLHDDINGNVELQNLEIDGFMRGEQQGKTMDVPFETVVQSLRKQNMDFQESYLRYMQIIRLSKAVKDRNLTLDAAALVLDLKRRVADIRNVAGCVFLKLCTEEKTT